MNDSNAQGPASASGKPAARVSEIHLPSIGMLHQGFKDSFIPSMLALGGRGAKADVNDLSNLFNEAVAQIGLAEDLLCRGSRALPANSLPGYILGKAAAILQSYGFAEDAQRVMEQIKSLPVSRAGTPGFHGP
jgi:hypothetical protein